MTKDNAVEQKKCMSGVAEAEDTLCTFDVYP